MQLDDDPWELNKNYPVEVGLIGHPLPALEELDATLRRTMSPEQVAAAARRANSHARRHAKTRAELLNQAEQQRDVRPLTPLRAMDALARALPDDVAVVEESPTTTGAYFERSGALKNTDRVRTNATSDTATTASLRIRLGMVGTRRGPDTSPSPPGCAVTSPPVFLIRQK